MRKRMRKIITIPGIALVATILLISGTAVAGWHYGLVVAAYYQCTNPNNITGQEDGENATIGVDTPLYGLGWITIDLGFSPMEAGQEFRVFASSRVIEKYDVYVGETDDFNDFIKVGNGTDDKNWDFYAPMQDKDWRYIRIDGVNGSYDLDSHYGPEIDAVGWYQP